MEACAVLYVRQDAARAVRNLPDAHACWQSYWRNLKFRAAIGRLEKAIHCLDVDELSEQQLTLCQEATETVIKAIEIHVSSSLLSPRYEAQRADFGRVTTRLRAAADALRQ